MKIEILILILASLAFSSQIEISDLKKPLNKQPKNGSFEKILSGHTKKILSVIHIKIGQIASLDEDSIKIWDSDKALLLRTINAFENGLTSLLLLKDGNIAAGSLYQYVKIWNPSTGKLVRILYGHMEAVISLCETSKGYLVTGSSDATIKIWNPSIGVLMRTLKGHTDKIRTLIALSDGRIVSGSKDKTIKIWNSDNGEIIKSINATKIPREFSILGDNLAVGFNDDSIQLLNLKDKMNKIFEKKFDNVDSFIAIKDFLLINSNKNVQIWSPTKNQMIKKLDENMVSSIHLLANSKFASVSSDQTISIWYDPLNANIWTLVNKISAHTQPITALTVLRNGNIVSGSSDKKIIIWNTEQGSMNKTIDADSQIYSLTVLGNGNLVGGSGDGKIKIWDSKGEKLIKTIYAFNKAVNCFLVIDNSTLASGSNDSSIKIYNTNNGSLLKTLYGHTNAVSSLAILPDGSLVSGSHDKSVRIWNQNGTSIRTLNGHKNEVNSVRVSKSGNIVSSSTDHTIKIWDPKTGNIIKNFDYGKKILKSRLLSNDNIVVLVDKHINVIDSKNGSVIKKMHPLLFSDVDVLDQDSQVRILNDKIILSRKKSIQIFNPMDESFIRNLSRKSILDKGIVTQESLIAIDENSTISLIDPKNEKLSKSFMPQTSTIVSILDLNDKKILSGYGNGKMRIWVKNTGIGKTIDTNYTTVTKYVLLDNGNVACLSLNGKIKIFNVEKDALIKEISESVSTKFIFPLSKGRLLSLSNESALIWDTNSGKLLTSLSTEATKTVGYEGLFFGTSLPNDNFALASTYIQIFDSKNGNLVCFLEGHNQAVNTIKLLKNGLLATGSNDRTIKIWNLKNCSLVKTLAGDTGRVFKIDELQNGDLIALTENDIVFFNI